jgi:general secretion pathway protein K
VALISALLLVALATATAVLISTRASLRIRSAENAQSAAQAMATARAAIEFGRWALRQDQLHDERNGAALDTLGEDWAQALPPLPVEGGSVSGVVHDAQAGINLNNLGLNPSANELRMTQAMLQANHLDPALVNAIRDWIDGDDRVTLPGGAEDTDYLALTPARIAANRPLTDVDELLRVRGFTPAIVAALRPLVCALPERTPVNVNTAPAEVLALLFNVGLADAQALVQLRSAQPFHDSMDLQTRAPPAIRQRLQATGDGTRVGNGPGVVAATPSGRDSVSGSAAAGATVPPQFHQDWDVASSYFQIDARATYGRVQYGLSALVKRDKARPAYPTILWERRTLF